MKLRYTLYIMLIFAMLLASCAPKTPAPEAADGGDEAAAPADSGEEMEAAGEAGACADDAFGCAEISAGDTIKIGMGAPMTGDYASFGIDISRGGEIAAADAGEFEGFAFELVAEDDQGSSEGGAAVANKFVADPSVAAIAGHIFSGATAAAIPIYDKAGFPMMSPSATNPALTEQGSAVFHRNAFTDSVQGQFAAEYLYNTLGVMTLAVMHDGGDYGQGLAQIVADTFEGLGGEVVAFEAITPGEADYSAPLAALASMSPEALYFGGYNAEAAVLTNQMGQSGLGDAIFFGCDGSFGADYLEKTGANGEGAYATTLIPPSTPEKEAFDAAYSENYGEEAGVLSPYSWNGYDSVSVLIDAIKSVGYVDGGTMYIPRGALVDAVRSTVGFEGIAGTITCQDNGECNASGPVFYVISGGEWVAAEAGQMPADMGPADAAAACAEDAYGCAEVASGDTVKIGMGAPMTGDYASFGIDISRGGEIAAADAGEFEGFVFELVAEDDQGSSEGGAAVANKFAADPSVAAIAGHIFSGATAAAIPIYDKVGYPMMSPSATNPPLTEMGSPAFNRNAFTDAVQGKFAGEYLYNTLGLTKIAVMHDGGDYGQGLAQIVADTFTALGGEVVAFEAITPGEADYSAPLAALAAHSPEALYFGGYNAEAAVLTNQMGQSGLGDAIFFGCDGSFGADYLEKTGPNGEGAYATTLIPPDTAEKLAFDAAYSDNYGEEAGVLSPYSWNGYDSVSVLIEAIKKTAIVEDGTMFIPRGALMAAVRSTAGFEGIAGTITCQDNGECNASGPVFYIIEGGEWVPAE